MSCDEQTPSSSRPVLVVIGLGLVGFTMAYILAPGPLAWLVNEDYVSVATAERVLVIFYPLQVVTEYVPPFNRFMTWWQGLWVG